MSRFGSIPACPDWRGLVAARDRRRDDPPGWGEALAHLDGCSPCRRAAIAADPTLAFRRLPAVPLAADEAARMHEAVAVLRRARRAPPRRRPLQRAASLVALATAGGLAIGHGSGPSAAPPEPSPAALVHDLAAEPWLEPLGQPFEQVLQMSDGSFSLVVLVDERLDV